MEGRPTQTRLHSLASNLAREAAQAGYTSLTVTVQPAPGQADTSTGSINLVMPPTANPPHDPPESGLIRADNTPELLQGVSHDHEFAFRHVVETILNQGYTDISIAATGTPLGVWEGTEPRRVAVLMLNRRRNCLVGISDFARRRGVSVDYLMTTEGLPEENRPIDPATARMAALERERAGYISAMDLLFAAELEDIDNRHGGEEGDSRC